MLLTRSPSNFFLFFALYTDETTSARRTLRVQVLQVLMDLHDVKTDPGPISVLECPYFSIYHRFLVHFESRTLVYFKDTNVDSAPSSLRVRDIYSFLSIWFTTPYTVDTRLIYFGMPEQKYTTLLFKHYHIVYQVYLKSSALHTAILRESTLVYPSLLLIH